MQPPTAQRSKIPAFSQGLLALALLLATLFVASPFIPRLVVSVAMVAAFVLVTATALMVTLVIVPLPRAPWTARAAQQALVSLLISLGLTMLPNPAPLWVAPAVFVVLIGGAESLLWTTLVGLGSGILLAGATRQPTAFEFLLSALGLGAVGLASSLAFSRIKARTHELSRTIIKMRQGADFLDTDIDPDATFRGSVRRRDAATLKKVSEEARTVRELDRSAHLTNTLAPFLELARGINKAHAALFFDIDHRRAGAFLRAVDGPPEIWEQAILPLDTDPVGFVLDRGRAFYATDFRSLLWSLPYYKTPKHIGTLLAVPVRVRGVIQGILIVDHEESQALAEAEPVLQRLAHLISQVVENERETIEHAEREVEFEAASHASQHIALITEVDQIHQFVVRALKEMAPRTIDAGIVRLHGDTIEGLPGMSEEFAEWVGQGSKRSEKTWIGWYLKETAEPMRIDTPRDRAMPLFRLGGGFPGESMLVQPLRFRNRLHGALVAVGQAGAYDASVGRVISLVANQAAAAIDLIELVEVNRLMALHDGLTGLLNRRAFDEQFGRALSQAGRAGQPLSLLMIDLDHFKQLNDTYGHSVGDLALQAAADEIRLQARGGDLAARYGGEEFAVILPDTDGAAAFRMAERLRKALADRVVKFGNEQIRITGSCGVSATDLGYETADALIHSADEALYASKETGRNRTSLAGAPRK
jgi:diguanylate cyclase (GGDEF)-like protein